MTWAKLGTEFYDQLVEMDFPDDLADAAMNTHAQAIHYVYSVENMALRFKRSTVRRFGTSPKADEAVRVLLEKGAWAAHGNEYELIHHADVIRQSIAAQNARKISNKQSQRRHRDRSRETTDVSADVSADVRLTQTDRQTGSNKAGDLEEEVDEQTGEVTVRQPVLSAVTDPWSSAAGTCRVVGCSEQLRTNQRKASGLCYEHHCERNAAS